MVVVSYEWYKTTYGGELDEDTFNRLASQAFLFADAMTEYTPRSMLAKISSTAGRSITAWASTVSWTT